MYYILSQITNEHREKWFGKTLKNILGIGSEIRFLFNRLILTSNSAEALVFQLSNLQERGIMDIGKKERYWNQKIYKILFTEMWLWSDFTYRWKLV